MKMDHCGQFENCVPRVFFCFFFWGGGGGGGGGIANIVALTETCCVSYFTI